MTIQEFFVLLVIGIIVAAVLFILKFYCKRDPWAFLFLLVVSYVGAWLSPAVVGTWGPILFGIWLVPALIGAFGLAIFIMFIIRSCCCQDPPGLPG